MTSDLDFTDELIGTTPPADPRALLREAVQHHQRGDLQRAESLYRQVLQSDPEQPDALHFLGLIAHQCGQSDAGIDLMQRSLARRPDNALYRNNLGGIYLQRQQFAEAATEFGRAVELKPDYADAWQHLGEACVGLAHLDEARRHYERALALNPDNAMVRAAQAALELTAGRFEMADALYDEAEQVAGDNADALYEIGRQRRAAGDAEQAARLFARVTELAPGKADAWLARGIALADAGRFDDATAQFRRTIEAESGHVRAHCRLIYAKRLTDATDPDLQALNALAARSQSLPDESRALIRFALGKAYDDLGDYDTAFEHFEIGNELKNRSLNYDADAHAAFFKAVRERFDESWLEAHRQVGCASRAPIFIVGVPRSGTSLVEQMLASHPEVSGGGEIPYLRQAIHLEIGGNDRDSDLPMRLGELDDDALRRIGSGYMFRIEQLAEGRSRATDKLPGNLAMLGPIHALFPNATIVHCRRDPRDTCLSCYTHLFEIGHEFSYSPDNLARFYNEYKRTMAHWHDVLPEGCIFELDYERLVTESEAEARRLLEYCGLEWNPACLEFHRNRRPVQTLSQAQIREPLYRHAIGRWRHYERQLAPLWEQL